MSKSSVISICAALMLLAAVREVRAQQSDSAMNDAPGQSAPSQQGAVPAARGIETAGEFETPADSATLVPDQRPLAGVERVGLGRSSEPSSFILPSITATTQLEVDPAGSGSSRVSSLSYLLGRLDLHRVSERSELTLDYAGGGTLSTYGSSENAAIQDLEFSEKIDWQRWSLLFGDEASYLSESPFGFGGVGGLGFLGGFSQPGPGGVLGGELPFVGAALVPSETIPTANVPRVSNLAVSQVEYRLTPRSSWTAAGSYGLLQFEGVGFINSKNVLFQTGYDYQLTPVSSIAIVYRYDAFRFTNLAQGINDQLMELSYGRRILGRLGFEIAAGPELDTFRLALNGPATQLSWTLSSSIDYQRGRNTLSLSYDRGLTGGSGVLVGAESNLAQGSLNRTLAPTWLLIVSVGYARNRGLEETSTALSPPVFDSWYSSVQFKHQMRPGMDLFFAYGANLQGMNSATCTSAGCQATYISHQLSLGFNWGLRPIGLR